MADEIRVDYPQLQQVAAQFSRQATAVNQTQQQVKRSMGQLQSAWVGQGSGAFFREMSDKVLPATNRLYQALQDASKTTRQIAQLMEQAERDAAAPFQDLSERWATLSNAQKQQALQSIANDIAREYGMSSLPVSVEQIQDPAGMDARGEWNGSKIRVDVDNLDNPDVINTVAHEARHAVQQSLGNKAVPGLWDSFLRKVGLQDAPQWPQYGISEETARAWDANSDNYKSPPKAYDPKNPDSVRQMNEYLNQMIEVDARQFGDQYYGRMSGRI
jgi:WXG100 family type VII secretion target